MKKLHFFYLFTVLVVWLLLGYSTNKLYAEDNYSEELHKAYNFAYKNGITTTSSIEKAKMNSPLTRIAMAKMLSQFAINVLGKKPNNSAVPNFTDVSKKLDGDYGWAVTLAYQLGIMWVGVEKFRPYDTVTRWEFWTALSRMLYSIPDWSPYYITHLDKLKREWIISNTKPKLEEKRWYVMLMLMRSQSSWLTTDSNNSSSTNNIPSNNNSKENANEERLTQDEVQKIIEKEEWLKEENLDSKWYECSQIGNLETCTYEFRYSFNWKTYIYYRDNTVSGKIKKVQDLWIDSAENAALKDAKVSREGVTIDQHFWSNWYIIIIEAKNNVFVYSMSLDSKIQKKKILITKNKALETILKEIKLEQMQSNIQKENKEFCSLSYSFLDDNHDTYQCSFTYWWKQYISYINAHDWTFIPIKKTASWWIQYWNSVSWKQNVIISEQYSYIDSDKAKELLVEKYNIKESSYWMMKKWEGKNAIYVYTVLGSNDDSAEYYIDAIDWTKMNSKDEIVSAIAKDSEVSKNNIKKKQKDDEDVSESIIETSYPDVKTNEVVSIYSFYNQWYTYTYKVRNIDWKILDSKKEADIWKDKAVELAKQAIAKKYSPELNDEYEIFNRNRAYLRYLSSSSDDQMLKSPSEPEYVISFTDKAEKNIYRVILKDDGNVISEDNISSEKLEWIFAYGFYLMWYNLDDLKDQSIEIWGTISL